MWETGMKELEAECRRIREGNELLRQRLENAPPEERPALEDQLRRNQALLTGKEICLQHMEIAFLMKEREADRERNPLFW